MTESEKDKFFEALNEILSGALIGFSIIGGLFLVVIVFALFL